MDGTLEELGKWQPNKETMPGKDPRVTVLMSVHNGSRYLRDATESILNQTYSDFEFLIVDDYSTDGTSEILTEYMLQDNRIRQMRNDRHLGLTKSLNRGLAVAKGEYILRMDADDISLPDRVAAQVQFLDTHSEVGVAGTAVGLIDAEGNGKQLIRFPEEHGVLRWLLCFFLNPIVHPTVAIRSQAILRTGTYDETLSTSQDYDLWCRMSVTTGLSNLPETLLLLRKHATSISNTRSLDQENNALAIGTRIIRNVAGGKISSKDIAGLWKLTFHPEAIGEGEIRRASRLIGRLTRCTLGRNNSLSITERAKITDDALRRLDVLRRHDKCGRVSRWRLVFFTHLIKRLASLN